MLGEVALVRHAAVPDHVIAAAKTVAGAAAAALHQGRKQARVVQQADLVAAEAVTGVLLYAPLGDFREAVTVLVTLERGHVPVHAELGGRHVVVLRRGRLQVVVVGPRVQHPPVRAVVEQPAGGQTTGVQ